MPSLAIIGRWLGASPPVTAIWIAIDEKLAKPQSAKVTIATVRGLSVSCRSEEHTSELQSLMRISYAVFCLKKKKHNSQKSTTTESPCISRTGNNTCENNE